MFPKINSEHTAECISGMKEDNFLSQVLYMERPLIWISPDVYVPW